ncbi:hypothetical protein JOD54_003879 [Actinokineospora baliensis]|nr:hypothetical protein [Actinokineospora baliensis]
MPVVARYWTCKPDDSDQHYDPGARGRRGGTLFGALAKWGWHRRPGTWSIPCRDRSGHRASITVEIAPAGVVVTSSAPGPWLLDPLRVGRLRAALRDAALTFSALDPALDDRPEAS